MTNNNSIVFDVIGWIFGIAVFAVGVVNTFWGNDQGFGIFLILLSFVFYPPVNTFFKRLTGFAIPLIAKIALGLFIIWASIGVGELFDKIDMMLGSF
ncbi:MAG: hypothetical protein H7Y42_17500 [Chitinophagaceae bacterium]|nr:hypothetical protein [Chitinophagaceae bacterium]